MKPGIYPDLTNAQYHGSAGVGSSRLRRIERTPAHLKGAKEERKDVFDQGTLIHTAVLEPHTFEDRVLVCDATRGTKIWKAAEEQAAAEGRLLSKSAPVETALAVRDAVHAKPHISRLILDEGVLIEHSAYALDKETGVLCRVRPDAVLPRMAAQLDVKSTRDASPEGFSRAIGEYGYHFQAAMYLDIWQQAGGLHCDRFILLPIEKEAPYECALYDLDAISLQEGFQRYREALERYAECSNQDRWPGYPHDVTTLSLKPWHFRSNPREQRGSLGFPIA